jgi:hypothetical protein
VYTEEEILLQKVQEELVFLEKNTRTSELFFLPEDVLGYPVQRTKDAGLGVPGFLVLLSVAVPLLLYSGYFVQPVSLVPATRTISVVHIASVVASPKSFVGHVK